MTRLIPYFRLYRTEFTIFGLAFLLRAAYAVVVQVTAGSHGFISFSDAEFFYYRAAINLFQHHAFSLAVNAPFAPESYHTPLYPLFVASFLALKLPLLAIAIAQSVLGGLMALMTYRIGQLLEVHRMVALIAAVLIAVEPMSIYWSGLLMSDTLFSFLTIGAFYFLIKRQPYLSFIALGLAALTRPIALYFAPFFIGIFIYHMCAERQSWKMVIQNGAIAILLFAAVVSPWFIRNKIVFNTFSFSSASWYLFYGFPLAEFAHDKNISIPPAAPDLPADRQFLRFDFKYSARYKHAFMDVVSKDPIGFMYVYLKRSIYSFVSDRYEYLVRGVVASKLPGLYIQIPSVGIFLLLALGQLFWLCVYVLVLLSVAIRRLWPWWLFFMTLVVVNAVLSGGINPVGTDMSRYSMSLYAFFFVFAGVGFEWLINKWQTRFSSVSSSEEK